MWTTEGATAVEDLIKYLKEKKDKEKLHPLLWSEPLAKASTDFAKAQGPTGKRGHNGPDGSTTKSRIDAAMKEFNKNSEKSIGENIQYINGSPLMALMYLAIDDSVPSRENRNKIF